MLADLIKSQDDSWIMRADYDEKGAEGKLFACAFSCSVCLADSVQVALPSWATSESSCFYSHLQSKNVEICI